MLADGACHTAPKQRACVVHGFASHWRDTLHRAEPLDRPKAAPGLNETARLNQLARIRFALITQRDVLGRIVSVDQGRLVPTTRNRRGGARTAAVTRDSGNRDGRTESL